MDENGLKAMKYIQRGRGFLYGGMYSCLFLSKCSISKKNLIKNKIISNNLKYFDKKRIAIFLKHSRYFI